MTDLGSGEGSSHPPQLLLLHGAYHDGRIWSPLRDCFDQLGVTSVAPTLDLEDPRSLDPFVGEGCAPTHVVAHSLAGALVGEWLARGGGSRGSISGIAYLAAYIPRQGESISKLVKQDRGSAVPSLLQRGPTDDCVRLSESGAREALYNDAPPELDLSPFLQGLLPQRTAAFSRPREAPPPGSSLPESAYLVCRRDRAITPALQRRMAADAQCREVRDLDAGHMPMVTCPQILMRVLLALWPKLRPVRT